MPVPPRKVIYGDLIGKTVYLAGPMSGFAHKNVPAFQAAEAYIKSCHAKVISPVHMAGDLAYAEYLQLSVKHLADCDVTVFLPGWENSPGAKVVYTAARALGLTLAGLYTANGPGCCDPRGLTWWSERAPHRVVL